MALGEEVVTCDCDRCAAAAASKTSMTMTHRSRSFGSEKNVRSGIFLLEFKQPFTTQYRLPDLRLVSMGELRLLRLRRGLVLCTEDYVLLADREMGTYVTVRARRATDARDSRR